MRKKIYVQTRNREIYQKFNMLNIVSEVIIDNTSEANLDKIIKKINKNYCSIESKVLSNNMILLKKKSNDIFFNVYMR